MFRKFVATASLVAGLGLGLGLGLSGQPASAVELAMTPSHVFGLWTNINNCLVASSPLVSEDLVWQQQMRSMTPNTFTGKKPSDVLDQVAMFREKLNRLRSAESLDPAREYGNGDGKITPSVVYLNSGHVLNALVDWTIRNSGPELLVSGFYDRDVPSGMTPSDVLGQVDLANRRLDILLAKHSG